MPLAELLPVGPGTAQWPVWGTTARVVVTGGPRVEDAEAVVRGVVAAVDAACSRFRPDSELERLQRRGSAGGVEVSPLLADLLAEALRAAERTGGDVDPTLAGALCDLGYDRDLAEIAASTGVGAPARVVARARTDWRAVTVTGRRVDLPPGARLDLGATAKASAADRCAAAVVRALGGGVLVALGGDVATAGAAPEHGWQVLVQDGRGEPACQVGLTAGAALATSSTRSRRWRSGGRELHHVLDPRTLAPAEPVWRTVSVAAHDCVSANTATTAALVRGRAAVPRLRALGLPARLVAADGAVTVLGGWPDPPRGVSG